MLGPTEKQEMKHYSSVSLENGGELCENVTYLGEYLWQAVIPLNSEACTRKRFRGEGRVTKGDMDNREEDTMYI